MDIVIPDGSIEVQTGLWAYLDTFTYNGQQYSHYNIYSAEGYCFYNLGQPENYYEDGTLKPPAERVYARICYTACETVEEVNANFVSVPIEDGFEIVSVGNKEETI